MRKLPLLLFPLLVACHGDATDNAPVSDASTQQDGSLAGGGNGDGGVDGDGDGEGMLPGDGGGKGDGTLDAGSDAGGEAVPLTERLDGLAWQSLSWAPAQCNVRIATELDSIDDAVWMPGTGAFAHCATWRSASLPSSFTALSVHAGGGYEAELMLGSINTEPTPDRVRVIYDLSGKARLAFRYVARDCPFHFVQAEDSLCHAFAWRKSGEVDTKIKCGDPLGDAPTFSSDEPFYTFQASEQLLAIGAGGGTYQRVFDRTMPQEPALKVPVPGNFYELAIRGRSMYSLLSSYESMQYVQRWWRNDDLGGWEQLYSAPAGRNIFRAFVQEGEQLAWLESMKVGYDSAQDPILFKAAFPAPGAALVPAQVKQLDGLVGVALSLRGGLLAYPGTGLVGLVRLSDAKSWTFSPAPNTQLGSLDPVWLDDTYVTYRSVDKLMPKDHVLVRCTLNEIMR